MLDLQKTAGNRAVGATLSRWGLPWFPKTAAPQWPKEPQVIIDGLVIPLESWSWSEGSGGTGAGSTGAGAVAAQRRPRHDDDGRPLLRSRAQGRPGTPIKTVLIVVPGKDGKGLPSRSTDVLITSYPISGSSCAADLSLSFAKKEFSQSPPQAQPRP